MNENYIKESAERAKKIQREFKAFNGDVDFILLNKLDDSIDVKNIISLLNSSVPRHLSYGLDAIYVGNFDELEQKKIESLYYAGIIYVKPNQKSDIDIVTDIVHEMAHNAEDNYQHLIQTNSLRSEFLNKRKRLYSILSDKGYNQIPLETYVNPNYVLEFDEFLYKTVGYDLLRDLTVELFVSPYAATSLREYFANGFEHYFFTYRKLGVTNSILLQNCPALLRLLKTLEKNP